MKKSFLLIIVFTLITSAKVFAQHNPNYTQFMFNKLALNPAYAGSKEALSIMGLYRHQWHGLIGAPKVANLNMHTSLYDNRIGLGINVVNDKIGMLNTSYINGMYAYRFQLESGILSTGIDVRFMHSRYDWSKALVLNVEDMNVPLDRPAATSFNFGFGLYYQTDKYYIGLSMPSILNKSIYNLDRSFSSFSRANRTFYMMGGILLNINNVVALKPSFLVSYISSVPFEVDINLSVIFLKTFSIGASYRLDDSVNATLQYSINQQLSIGIAADYPLSELRNQTMGSMEMCLEYVFREGKGKKGISFFD